MPRPERKTTITSRSSHGGSDTPASPPQDKPVIRPATLRAVERASGGLATRSVARMDDELAWFRTLPADQRSWVTLVAQAGIAGYVGWAENPSSDIRIAEQVFGTAPRDLIRAVSLRRTVELVRVAITVAEEHVPALGVDEGERAALRESLLRYSREIAFAAAAVYATAAETRGAWDARVEAAVVDGIVRGEDPQTLTSRAATLSWDPAALVRVVIGSTPLTDRAQAVAAAGEWARRRGTQSMAAVHGDVFVVVLAGELTPDPSIAALFGDGPVVRGLNDTGLAGASRSAADALSGYRVATLWPDAPRPVDADKLLPERALDGDERAWRRLRDAIFTPLATAASPLLDTVDAYVAHGGGVEPAARSLFIHPNTMRYRLRRVAELTNLDPWEPRDLLTLTIALMVGRLRDQREP